MRDALHLCMKRNILEFRVAFRADEAASNGLERVKNYLLPRHLSPAERERGEKILTEIINKCGPVVEGYPTWHPLVSNHDDRSPETLPNEECGYR